MIYQIFMMFAFVTGTFGYGIVVNGINGPIYGTVGQNISITCVADPKNNYTSDLMTFDFGKRKLTDLPDYKVEIKNDTAIILHIYNAIPMYKTLYCLYNESEGIDVIYLSFGYPPQNVTDFQCRSYNLDYMNCTFTAPWNTLLPKYKLTFSINSFETFETDKPKVVNDRFFEYIITRSSIGSYRPGHQDYKFYLHSSNVLGNNSQIFRINHFKYTIPSPPENITCTHETSNSVQLNWVASFQMSLFRYPITYKIMVSDTNGTFTQYARFNVKEASHIGYNLTLPYANKWYDVRIYTKVSIAADIPEMWTFKEKMVKTAPNVPTKTPATAPGSFYQSIDKDYVNIFWKEVDFKYRNSENYTVLIEDENGNNIVPLDVTSTMAKLPYKGRNVTYRLYSTNDVGKSENYSEIYIPPYILSNVANIRKFLVNNTYNISWDYTSPSLVHNINFTGFWCPGKPLTIDQCSKSIDFKVMNINQRYFLYEPESDVNVVNFAVAVTSRYASSGMVWAQCGAYPDSDIGKLSTFESIIIRSDFIQYRWELDCLYEQLVIGFNLSYCKIGNPKEACVGNITYINLPAETREYRLTGLEPYTTYSTSVKMFSEKKEGALSVPLLTTTFPSAPSLPRNLKVTNVTNTTINLSWNVPEHENGVINKYIVQYISKYGNGSKESTVIEGNNQSAILTNLESYTDFKISVKACVSFHDCSNASSSITVKTHIGIPNPVTHVHTTRNAEFQILSWSPGKRTGPIEMYDIIIRITRKDLTTSYYTSTVDGTKCSIVNSDPSWCTADDLNYEIFVQPKTKYRINELTATDSKAKVFIYTDNNTTHNKLIEKRNSNYDNDPNNANRISEKSINKEESDSINYNKMMMNGKINYNENKLQCVENVELDYNIDYYYGDLSTGVHILCTEYGIGFSYVVCIVIPVLIIATLLVAMFFSYRKYQKMINFEIDLPDGLKDIKDFKPNSKYDFNNTNNIIISPYIRASEEQSCKIEQEQCLLSKRLDCSSSNSNSDNNSNCEFNEAIEDTESTQPQNLHNNQIINLSQNNVICHPNKSDSSTNNIPLQLNKLTVPSAEEEKIYSISTVSTITMPSCDSVSPNIFDKPVMTTATVTSSAASPLDGGGGGGGGGYVTLDTIQKNNGYLRHSAINDIKNDPPKLIEDSQDDPNTNNSTIELRGYVTRNQLFTAAVQRNSSTQDNNVNS